MTLQPGTLRAGAEGLASALPPLLAEAEHLAATVMLGTHGRRRAGRGDEFWQYRPALPGDAAHSIDWRRSARTDAHFIREKEWQNAQSVWIWADNAKSMEFCSERSLRSKGQRARVLALAMSILLIRGGERVGLAGGRALAPSAGDAQLARLTEILASEESESDYGTPDLSAVRAHGRVLLFSDFLADPAKLTEEIARNAGKGVRGALVQVLDPQEEAFPFTGRTIFESMGRSLSHETLRAKDLRTAYLDRLASRRAVLGDLASRHGWLFHSCHTSDPALVALLWAYWAMERRD